MKHKNPKRKCGRDFSVRFNIFYSKSTGFLEWITETDTKEIRFISEMDYSKLNRAQKDKVYDEFAWKPDAYLQSQTFKPEKCLDRLEKVLFRSFEAILRSGT